MGNPARRIAGTVTDAAGRPLAQARVYFKSSPAAVPDVAALTGADGGFVLMAPHPGDYEIGATSDAKGTGSSRVTVGSKDASVQIRLAR